MSGRGSSRADKKRKSISVFGNDEEGGSVQSVGCTADGCDIWTHCWIPDELKDSKAPFICGFCNAKQLETLWKGLKELHGQQTTVTDGIAELQGTQKLTKKELQDLKSEQCTATKELKEQIEKKEEPKSFALALKENLASNTATCAVIAKEVKKENEWRAAKELNLVIKGTKPTGKEDDANFMKELCKTLKLNEMKCTTKRIGKTDDNGMQLMLATFDEKKDKWTILKAAKNLKDSPAFKDIYINLDLTKAEMQQDYELRKELREAKANNPTKKYQIKKGKVTELTNEED